MILHKSHRLVYRAPVKSWFRRNITGLNTAVLCLSPLDYFISILTPERLSRLAVTVLWSLGWKTGYKNHGKWLPILFAPRVRVYSSNSRLTRLGISLEEFTRLALKHSGNPPRVAARCSVFAKSDLIHLQQKGVPIEAMCYALCESIASMVVSQRKGVYEEPVYFVGGVAANAAILKAIENVLSAKNGHPIQVIVPENYLLSGISGGGAAIEREIIEGNHASGNGNSAALF